MIEPQTADYWPQISKIGNTDTIALSRFAYLRRRGKEMVLESPRATALFRISDPKIIETSYNDFKQQSPVNLEPSRPGAQNIIDQFPALKSRNIDDYLDIAVLDGLRKEGFFVEMERKYVKH